MSQKNERRRRQRARDDVVVQMRRRVGDPPPQMNVEIAKDHCRWCRLRYWLSGWLVRGIVAHNPAARDYIARAAEYTR